MPAHDDVRVTSPCEWLPCPHDDHVRVTHARHQCVRMARKIHASTMIMDVEDTPVRRGAASHGAVGSRASLAGSDEGGVEAS